MKIKIKKANLVILATAHNPSILSVPWLKEKKLINVDPKQFMHTPDISLFDTESFSLIVDRQRLFYSVKKHNLNNLKSLARFGNKYIKILPHIPYTALGINFAWINKLKKDESFQKICIDKDSKLNLRKVFLNHDLNFGYIVFARKKPYLLKLTIEPKGKTELIFNFNYHHEVKGIDIDIVRGYIDNFIKYYKHSKKIVENICLGGGKRR